MKFSKLIVLFFLFAARPVHAQFPAEVPTPLPGGLNRQTITICAGNVPPLGTVITSTGNSVTCGGSCRSREIEPVHGPIMIICAQQPIPDKYEIQSITSTPDCNCLGDEDNAYVIRAVAPIYSPTPGGQIGPQGPLPPGLQGPQAVPFPTPGPPPFSQSLGQ